MDPLVIRPTVVLPADELSAAFSRASGPGGQNVNRVETRVELTYALSTSEALPPEVRARLRRLAGPRRTTRDGDVVITGQRYRSQPQNLEDCRARLAALVAQALEPPPPPRRPTRPGRAAKERRLRAKRVQGERKRGRGRIDRSDLG